MKKDSPKKELTWFLRFINANIEDMPQEELYSLWRGLRKRIYGPFGVMAIPTEEILNWPELRKSAIVLQKFLKDLLEKILRTAQTKKKTMIRPHFSFDEEVEEGLFKTVVIEDDEKGDVFWYEEPTEKVPPFSNILEEIILSETKRKPLPGWVEDYIADSHNMSLKIIAHQDSVFPFFTNPKNKLVLEFSNLLSQFPLSSIRTCQRSDCGKYFLKATKKEKRYCSNRCAWVMASRQRRTNQPEAEKAKKRASYERRRKRDLGPGVKVQKRV